MGLVAHLGSVRGRKEGPFKSRGEKVTLAMFTEVKTLRIQLAWHHRPLVTLAAVVSMKCHGGGGSQCE